MNNKMIIMNDSNENNIKDEILNQLNLSAIRVKNQIFKYKSYIKFINSIENYSNDLNTLNEFNKLFEEMKIKKSSIKDKIISYIKSNDISVFGNTIETPININNVTIKKHKIINDFKNIYGVGFKKANDLYEKEKIYSINQLKRRIETDKDNKILNKKQKIGLEYYDDLLERIPYNEIEEHDKFIDDEIKIIKEEFKKETDLKDIELNYKITGSYRRNNITSGDIDILFSSNDDRKNKIILNHIIKKLKNKKYIAETLALGDKKFMGICKLYNVYRRIDIVFSEQKSYPFTLLYFTGSGDFNIDLRNYCLGKGYRLNEYGLKYTNGEKKGKFVQHQFKNENDIFEFLGIKYIKPEHRIKNIIDINQI
jgi:DNA polymerase beta